MIRSALTLVMCICFTTVAAQPVLEHSYTGGSHFQSVTLEGEGDKYYLWDTTTKTVKIFNPDHSLWKTIPSALPSGRGMATLFPPSTKLFDLDNSVEIFYTSYSSGVGSDLRVVNEDGTTMLVAPDANYAWIKKVNGAWKLLAVYAYNSQVYGLPGTLPQQSTGLKPVLYERSETAIYPNPVEESAIITYKLPDGIHQANLNIYSNTGQLVKQMVVTDNFDNIIFSPGDLNTGVYYYELAGQKQQFVIR